MEDPGLGRKRRVGIVVKMGGGGGESRGVQGQLRLVTPFLPSVASSLSPS